MVRAYGCGLSEVGSKADVGLGDSRVWVRVG